MKEPCFYFDIDKQERDTVIRHLLSSILRSRVELQPHQTHGEERGDEDVNVYLAHLLFAIALPEYHELSDPYLSENSSDVLRWAQATDDRTIRYFIFKVNADHLLVHLSIFDDLGVRRGVFSRSEKHFAELSRLYYEQAASYHARIYRKRTGVGDVLQKISKNFDFYWGLLKLVRRNYFDFVIRYRDQAFDRFMEEFNRYEKESTRQERIDQFLDLYSEWLKTKNPDLERRIHAEIEQLRQFDPDFGKGVFRVPTGP